MVEELPLKPSVSVPPDFLFSYGESDNRMVEELLLFFLIPPHYNNNECTRSNNTPVTGFEGKASA
jgi:hypothetical protein